MRQRSASFGPSALATPANVVSLARIVAAPLMIVLVVTTGPSSWLLVALWFVFSSSDGLDGVLARRQGATRSGAFLDPLADKVLVLGVLGALAGIGEIGWVPVLLIAAREIAMSVFRSYAGRRGISIPARGSAKVKTLLQDLVIGLAFFPPVGRTHASVVEWSLWVVVAVTVWTGLEYLRDGRRILAGAGRVSPSALTGRSAA